MKEWKKPDVVTVREEELKEYVMAGACSYYCVLHIYLGAPKE